MGLITTTPGFAETMRSLYKFTGENPDPAWSATNDGVMGGESEGGASLVEDGMLFEGRLSLENNGGFSSINDRVELDLSGYDGISFRVLGDGRTYLLRLRSDARYGDRGPVAFSKPFQTVKGEWTDVFLSFDGLRQSWRGRDLSGYPFNAGSIQRIGFMLADKQAGPFRLLIEDIAASPAMDAPQRQSAGE